MQVELAHATCELPHESSPGSTDLRQDGVSTDVRAVLRPAQAVTPRSPSDRVNVADRLGLGCLGTIEHTNFIPAERYGGRTLVYLAHYVECDGIRDVHVNRDPFAQPVPNVGGPIPGLPMETGLPGLFHASLAHVDPDDRGVSKALGLGARVAQAADKYRARVG